MTEALVRHVDHVFVPVADPVPLFALFTHTLGLPVAWPIRDDGAFASGGVCLGNMNIEFVRADPTLSEYFAATEPLTVRGIAFEPFADHGWAEALDERKLRHLGPVPYERESGVGAAGILSTNTYLGGLVGDAAVAFICHYHSERAVRGRTAREAMDRADGGAIGVRRVAEITIGVNDLEKAERRWRRFLSPAEPDGYGLFRVGKGPAIRLRHSSIEGVAGMWVEVASLATAREALRERDLLGPIRASGIGLDYTRTGGLDVWLTEAR